jgi:hypothetical protein
MAFARVSGAEFGHEAREVGLDGAEADVQVVSDLGVGSTVGWFDQNFFLATDEPCDELSSRRPDACVREGCESRAVMLGAIRSSAPWPRLRRAALSPGLAV